MFFSRRRRSRRTRKPARQVGFDRRGFSRVRLEDLEPRRLLATILVTSAGDTIAVDSGVTLREAIASIDGGANVNADVAASGAYGTNDTIDFNIPGAGVQTISVGGTGDGALPALTKPVTINGYSQPAASANGLSSADNAVILIELSGASAGPDADGLDINGGGSTIEGLAINRFSGDGIKLSAGNGNTVSGNFIGVNPSGGVAQSNGLDGVLVTGGSSNDTIGGPTAAARNVISGNAGDGVHIVGLVATPSAGDAVQGDFIGVNSAGTGPVGARPGGAHAGSAAGNFGAGIELDGAKNSTVGGGAAGAGNVVGFNLYGIELDDGAQGDVVAGNLVGLGADGASAAGNLLQGIALTSKGASGGQAGEPGVQNNTIGGTAVGAANNVANNGAAGVAVFNNPISLSAQLNVGNAILGNAIFRNGLNNPTFEPGIDLSTQFIFPADDGVTANTADGPHVGPNSFQNFPVLTSATPGGGNITIAGTLDSSPNTSFRIEFFVNPAASGGALTEGQTFLGFASVTTNGSDNATFNATFAAAVAPGQTITATATDANNNTSEFSAPIPAANLAPTLSGISPAATPEGAGVTLTVNGANFAGNSTVMLNGVALATTFVNNTQLTAVAPAGLLADEGAFAVIVANPAPGGGASNAQTLTVQESLLPDGTRGTANQRFVSESYHDLLGRPIDAAGLAFWTAQLTAGASRNAVASAIQASGEYRADEVQALYQTYLHRPADSAGLAGAVNILAAGGSREEIAAILVGSSEYFADRGGGTNDGFIGALFQDGFQRAADATGLAQFRQFLAAGHSRTEAALVVFGSEEYREDLVRGWYPEFLERPVDQAGLAASTNLLARGTPDDQVIAAIVSSQEYFNKTAS